MFDIALAKQISADLWLNQKTTKILKLSEPSPQIFSS